MHKSTKQKIDELTKNGTIYFLLMLGSRKNKFWSDSVKEIEQYIAEKTIMKDEA